MTCQLLCLKKATHDPQGGLIGSAFAVLRMVEITDAVHSGQPDTGEPYALMLLLREDVQTYVGPLAVRDA